MADDSGAKTSERYELEEMFPEEPSGAIHVYKVVGMVILVLLLALALTYPFLVGE